jgi:hypothetical protein
MAKSTGADKARDSALVSPKPLAAILVFDTVYHGGESTCIAVAFWRMKPPNPSPIPEIT